MNPSVRQRILLIDDEAGFREVIARSLVKHGFEVQEAADGKEGLRQAAESHPDLILCDLIMPEMNGYEVLAALRGDDRLAAIPVIFLTAHSEPAEVRHGMNLGADDYLIKPANILDLLGAINARIARRQSELNRQEKQMERALRILAETARDLRNPPETIAEAGEELTGPVIENDPVVRGGASELSEAGSFLVKTATEKRVVKISDIKSIIAYGEYSWVYWDKGDKGALLRKSLKKWQSELPREHFIRVHRRAIINLTFMERVERLPGGRLQIHLRNTPEPILVSLSQTPAVNRKLNALCV